MKALTIWQPWASLVIVGAKPYEFRSWPAYRGMIGQRIVIHASARRIRRVEIEDILFKLRAGGEVAAQTCLLPEKAIPVLERALETEVTREFGRVDLTGHGDLPWGVGLGTAVLGEPRNGFDIAEEFGLPRANDSDRDHHANYGWPMLDVEQWASPIPMKGAQGFWNWPTPEDHAL